MRVIVNGKPAKALDARLARRITARREAEVAEGVVMSAAEIIATADRRMKLLFGAAGGLALLITVGILIGAGVGEPGALTLAAPLAAALALALGGLLVFVYRRNLAKVTARVGPRLARLPTPGTAIRADASGLTIGGHAEPWPAIEVDEIEIRDMRSDDADWALIECLTLRAGGRSIGLDTMAITRGRAVVDKAWARLREQAT